MEEEKVVEKKPIKKRKVKTWGDNGFVGKIQYGCYEYTVKFLPEEEVIKYIDTVPAPRTYGAICCDD